MWAVVEEARKHWSFREAKIAWPLAAAYYLLRLYATPPTTAVEWFSIQQDIYTFGATLAAFLIAVGLPRLICVERERGTDRLICTVEQGRLVTFGAKTAFALLYCVAVVLIIGTVSLLVPYIVNGLDGAFEPIKDCVYFPKDGLPPMSNLAYCIIQYVFLLLGTWCFAGFILLLAMLSNRTALTIILSGGTYLALIAYCYVGKGWITGAAWYVCDALFHLSFGGFMLQESYSWIPFSDSYTSFTSQMPWGDVGKPILWVLFVTAAKFVLLWLLWKRRERK